MYAELKESIRINFLFLCEFLQCYEPLQPFRIEMSGQVSVSLIKTVLLLLYANCDSF